MDAANATVDTASTRGTSAQPGVWRTGPIGRLYRLALTVLLGWTAVDLLMDGISGFSMPDTPRQSGFWRHQVASWAP